MPDEYPLTSGQLLQIALKELAKPVPILGQILSAHSSVFGKIEQNRIKAFVVELAARVERLESRLQEQRPAEIALFACDVVRSELLIGDKAASYAAVVAGFIANETEDMNLVVEILDNLRKLNLTDLKVLYRFKHAEMGSLPMERVADFQPGYDLGEVMSRNQSKMEEIFPAVLRLESLGLLYRTSDDFLSGPVLNIGPLSRELNKRAHLSQAGARVIAHLPK